MVVVNNSWYRRDVIRLYGGNSGSGVYVTPDKDRRTKTWKLTKHWSRTDVFDKIIDIKTLCLCPIRTPNAG